MNWAEKISIFTIAGFFGSIAAVVGFKVPFGDALIGCFIMVAITLLGILVAQLMPGNLPMVFWVSIIAIASTLPISPVGQFVTTYTSKVDFLAICTIVLSYAGLTVGKDMHMFKKMSWRIVVVALAVYTGTFVCATVIAQLMLHLEGII